MEIAVNIWTENERNIIILNAKNDAWDENSILCKIIFSKKIVKTCIFYGIR